MTPLRHTGCMMFQTRCAGCDAPGVAVCTTCRFALLGPRPRVGADGVHAALPFAGRARDVVLGLKYRNRRQVARHLAGLVVNAIVANGDHEGIDVVTWAPTSSARRRARGFDQAELIARLRRPPARCAVAPPARPVRRRAHPDGPVSPGAARRADLQGAADRSPVGRCSLVDDVVTTGATLRSARRALDRAGAAEVRLYAVAATPVGVAGSRRPVPRRALGSIAA